MMEQEQNNTVISPKKFPNPNLTITKNKSQFLKNEDSGSPNYGENPQVHHPLRYTLNFSAHCPPDLSATSLRRLPLKCLHLKFELEAEVHALLGGVK